MVWSLRRHGDGAAAQFEQGIEVAFGESDDGARHHLRRHGDDGRNHAALADMAGGLGRRSRIRFQYMKPLITTDQFISRYRRQSSME